jgi:hypothetical protein
VRVTINSVFYNFFHSCPWPLAGMGAGRGGCKQGVCPTPCAFLEKIKIKNKMEFLEFNSILPNANTKVKII